MNPPGPPVRQSPVVPSKNALRALRRLALSPSILVISTIGSVCGIATLNYDVHRRVRLAEQALESKKIIRSLSHGRGAAQLNAMIEAAERGEDFTLNTRSAKKRRRKNTSTRSFSAAALQDPSERTHDVDSDGLSVHLKSQYIPFSRKVSSDRAMTRSGSPSYTLPTHMKGVHSMAVEKILEASKAQHKLPNHQTYGRPNQQRQSEAERAKILLENWFKPLDETYDGRIPQSMPSPPLNSATTSTPEVRIRFIESMIGNVEGSDASKTQMTHLDAPKTLETQDQREPAPVSPPPQLALLPPDNLEMVHVPGWEYESENEIGGKSPFGSPQLNQTHSSTRLGHDSPNAARARRGAVRYPENEAGYLLAHLDDEPVDQALRKWIHTTKPSHHKEMPVEMLSLSTPEDFVDYARNVLQTGAWSSLRRFMRINTVNASRYRTYRQWLAIMRHFTSQHGTVNWAMAEAMFYAYRPLFNPIDLGVRPVFDLIQQLLATVPTSNRIQQILFPSFIHDPVNAAEPFELSIRYLQFFCEGQHSISECLLEMGQIIDIAKHCDLVPCKRLALPVLRAIVRSKDFEAAETVLEDLTPLFGPTDSLDLLAEYTFLNACEGNWRVVETMLGRIHSADRSRSHPISSARLFRRLLLQHTARNPSAQSFGFTIQAMKYAGLIPTGHVSRTLLCACIRDGRYDLIVNWLRLIREAFPRVSPGFDRSQGGWAFTDYLAEIGASCEEIAKVCQAIAYGCRKDPFGPDFREFAVELIRLDMSHRLCAASAHVSIGNVSSEDIRSMTMEQLLRHAYEFRATSTTTSSNGAYIEGLKSDLAIQISAIVDLAKVFRGDMKVLFFGIKDRQDMLLKSRRNVAQEQNLRETDALKRTFPEIFRSKRSPGIGQLTAALVEHYDQRDKQDLPIDHSLLKHFITTVSPEYPSEVLELVEAIYASGFVQGQDGTPFDTDIFKKWLYLVSTDGSVKSAVAVLSAVVVSASHLEWTAHFRHLCEFVAHLGSLDNDTLWDETRFPKQPENEDLRSLYHKIKRKWVDADRQRKETFRFPEWKGWEMDVR